MNKYVLNDVSNGNKYSNKYVLRKALNIVINMYQTVINNVLKKAH